jgi:CxxC-x17-CxxC domain-containing protein
MVELLFDMPGAVAQYEAFRMSQPHRAVDSINCEACSGDHLINCKNCRDVFVLKDSEECRYCAFCEGNRFCMDANFSNVGELQFNSTNLVKNYHVLFANLAWYNNNCIYITSCFNSSNLFGCIGMKKHAYCIFNKQYTQEEYEELVPRIIDHMRKDSGAAMNWSGATGSWGQYYPSKYSPFGFNETAANVEHPLDRTAVLERGWKWHEEKTLSPQKAGTHHRIPQSIANVSDDIIALILTCEVTGKPYKIVLQELAFYRQMNIPIPKRCPDQRQKDRVALRNPHVLWKRTCAQCGKEMETTYQPSRLEIVYCEKCYLKAVY